MLVITMSALVAQDSKETAVPVPLVGLVGSPPANYFTENVGQVRDGDVLFYYSAGDMQVGFSEGTVLLKLRNQLQNSTDSNPGGVLIRLAFVAANPVAPKGRGELPLRGNYIHGKDSRQWQTNVRSYSEVLFEDLYEGIDLVYRIEGTLKYEFVIHPGADPSMIEATFEGVSSLLIDEGGDLVAHTVAGDLRDSTPIAYQERDRVQCAFVLRSLLSWGFDCEAWDSSRPLIIDPLVYSTYLGGVSNDYGMCMVVDGAGNAYISGHTDPVGFPVTPGAYDETYNGFIDLFVSKLNPSGSALVYSTYIGGDSIDQEATIALDASGNVYVTGHTQSANFPTTPGAFDTSYNGGKDAFVVKLNAAGGDIIYSTYLGGTADDVGHSIAVDSSGATYVTGFTWSTDYPTIAGGFEPAHNGNVDVFVTKLDPSGSTLIYSSFLGGSGFDGGNSLDMGQGPAIAIDQANSAYVTGFTNSADFPVTMNALDDTFNGVWDAFVAKVNASGTALVYATYLGGGDDDEGYSVFVDSLGNAYVAGSTSSSNFPVSPAAFDTTYNGGGDAFVTKLNASGEAIMYSTFIGGSGNDLNGATKWTDANVAVDGMGKAYIVGNTGSSDFPTTVGAFDSSYNGGRDTFVLGLDSAGSSLTYSTYLGGGGWEIGYSIALDPMGYVYVTGSTMSSDFPTTAGSIYTTHQGAMWDAFVTKLRIGFEMHLNTFPQGLQLEVNGSSAATPYSFQCNLDSSFVANAPSPQNDAASRHTFVNWSDGGAQSHVILCDGTKNLTAYFTTEFEITIDTIPDNMLIEVDGNPFTAPYVFRCQSGTLHDVMARSPQGNGTARYLFAAWSDGGWKSRTISCESSHTLVARFDTEFKVTIDSSPANLVVLVDGSAFVAPQTFWWAKGSSHAIDVPSPQHIGTDTFVYVSWSSGGEKSQITISTAPMTLTVAFTVTDETEVGVVGYWWILLLAVGIAVLLLLVFFLRGRKRKTEAGNARHPD
jgi:hypothetical protein